jgi:MFS family permease
LHFSDSEAGVLGSVFIFMTFIAVIPAGYMADRFRRTRVVGLTLASWGVISAINAAVRNFGQFLGVRAVLGIGETVNGPSAQSLMADYYPAGLRGRAYAYQRVSPILGYAVGLAVGGVVGSALGWRAGFLVVGVPASVLAFWVYRMREPVRGESENVETEGGGALIAAATRRGWRALLADLKIATRVPSLRALIVGTAISTGATAGIAFWAAAFYERHTTLSVKTASTLVGSIILVGAAVGTILGGRAADRARHRDPGAPMRLAGTTQFASGLILAATFLHEPIFVRLIGQVIGVALLVAAFPALTAMASEVVPPAIRGTAFALTGFLAALASSLSPLLIGVIADRFPIQAHGETKGNLAIAFAAVMPLVLIGALVVLNGRRHVSSDIANVKALEARLGAEAENR